MSNKDNTTTKTLRCKVLDINNQELKISFLETYDTAFLTLSENQRYLLKTAWCGAVLNLLNWECCDGTYRAQRIILQPDYLVDISQLSNCFKDYGARHPLFYIYKLVEPIKPSAYALLGNTVNLFFDDAIQNESKSYHESLIEAFRNDAIQFLTTDKLTEIYFSQIQGQYKNVHQCIAQDFPRQMPAIHKDKGILEPSFICPQLGIQGRLDFLELDLFASEDQKEERHASLIELKSGKLDEYKQCHKIAHYVQLLLYTELLHYNQGIPYNHIHSYLLYSKYPQLLSEPMINAIVDEALEIRNEIMGMLQQIIEGHGESLFTETAVEGILSSGNKLWQEYEKPRLLELVKTIQFAPQYLHDWFLKQLQYIVTEDAMARLGVPENPQDQGSSSLWLSSLEQKIFDGEIIHNLTFKDYHLNDSKEIIGVCFNILSPTLTAAQTSALQTTGGSDFQEIGSPNFRVGDEVLFYHADSDKDNATNQVIFRGNIAFISDTELQIELRQTLRDQFFEPWLQSRFACEHDKVNNNMSINCRSIYMMLLSGSRWKELLIKDAPALEPQKSITDDSTNDGLNDAQLHSHRIIKQMLNAPEYYLLVGPPGTGKTSVVLYNVVKHIYENTDQKILLLSYTHRAVDEICKSLDCIDNIHYMRMGHSLHCHPDFHDRLLRHKIKDITTRKDLLDTFHSCRVFVGTTASFNSQHSIFDLVKFDTIIVDEASQLLEYHIIELLTHAQRFFMIGDHKQLPAVTLQSTGQSLFERLYATALKQTPQLVGTLIYQGRMHQELTDYANKLFYNNILRIIPLKHQEGTLDYTCLGENMLSRRLALARALFFDVPSDPIIGRKYNNNEAKTVARITQAISMLYQANGKSFNETTLGIIVPYRSQISAIYNAIAALQVEELPLINIDTVERYQGSQRDIIIYSATVSAPSQLEQLSVVANCDGTEVDRKLNVIITRARKQLFVIGNKGLLTTNKIYRALIELIESH